VTIVEIMERLNEMRGESLRLEKDIKKIIN